MKALSLGIRTTLIAVVASILSVPSAFSTTIFYDNFDGYPDDASLTAVWTRVSGTSSSIFLAPSPSDASDQTVTQTSAAGRLRLVIPGGIVPTATEPVINFSFDLYDTTGGTNSGRVYGEIRNSASASGLLAAGLYNVATIGIFDQSRYQARTIDGGGWIQLAALRTVGWHNFRFEIIGNRASLYVDNLLEPNFTNVAAGSATYDWVHIGSGLTGLTSAFFDNLNVAITPIPEPEAYAMLLAGFGLLGFAARRRKQQAA
jgi:hypothetical protein